MNETTAATATSGTKDPSKATTAREWEMILHFSVLTSLLVPLLGVLAPLLIWQIKKEQFPSLTPHAHVVFNWILSLLVYSVGLFVSFLLVGVVFGRLGLSTLMILAGVGLLATLTLVGLLFPIVGGIKAGKGELWAYPLSIPFFR